MRIVRALPYLVSGVTVVLLLAGAGGGQQANVIRATRIELVDRNGNLRGYWSAEDPNCLELRIVAGNLSIKDEDGKLRVGLGVSKAGTRLGLADANGTVRALMALDKDGPWLGLLDANGNPRAEMAVTKDRHGLALSDANGKVRTALSVTKDGPGLGLYDANGNPRVGMALAKDWPGLFLADEHAGVVLTGPKDGPAAIEPQLCTVNSTGRQSSVPVSALAFLFNEYRSGNLGGGTTVIGVPYASPPSTNTPGASPLDEFMSGFFREMGRKAADPGR